MRRIGLWTVTLLAIGVALYAGLAYLFLPAGSTVAPAMKAIYQAHLGWILTHVFASAVALVVGPFQFFPKLRARKTLHRTLGYLYLLCVTVGGVSGLVMAFLAQGGLVATLGFGLLAILWLVSGANLLLSIKAGRSAGHERWAIRCFALSFAAVTLRIYLGGFFAAGFAFEEFYPSLAWLCWVPNVVFCEWVLLRPAQPDGQC